MASKGTAKSIGLKASSGHRVLSFGLVRIEVGLTPALDDTTRISGHLVDPETLTRVKQVYQTEAGQLLTRAECGKAYEWEGKKVELRKDELPFPDTTNTIELVACVPDEDVPAEWVSKTHLAFPSDKASDQAYMVTAKHLRNKGKALIGTCIDSDSTKGFAVRWSETYECLIAQVLHYEAQVRWANIKTIREGLDTIPAPPPELVAVAEQLFDTLPDEFAWDTVSDTYGEALEKVVEAKAKGQAAPSTPAAPEAPAADLMAALQASLAQAPKEAKKPRSRKKVAA